MKTKGNADEGRSVIVTLTPNPSVDRTVEVARLHRGGVMRAHTTRLDAGGKGVNVARALAANGHKAIAVLPSGGAEGLRLGALLAQSGLEIVTVPVGGAVRSNVTVVEPEGVTTKINEPGPRLVEAEIRALAEATLTAASGAAWVVLCGSLPPGVPEVFYRDLIGPLRATGARVALDTSGPALARSLPAGPDLVKPNREELAEAAGLPVRTLGDVVRAGQRLRAAGAGQVLASLGPDGALLVTGEGCWLATGQVCEPRSTVGAGDALLAGYLCGGGDGPDALAHALAFGTAAILLPGSRMPEPADLDLAAVRVHSSFDPDQPLSQR
jgi:1-phosphofructokinase